MACQTCGASTSDGVTHCDTCRRDHGEWKWTEGLPFAASALAPERFERAERDPEHARALTHEPEESTGSGWLIGLLTIAFGLFMALIPQSNPARGGLILQIVGGVLGLFTTILGFMLILEVHRHEQQPFIRHVAVLVEQRVETRRMHKGGEYQNHRATFLLRTGELIDVACSPDLAGHMKAPDIGMVFLKHRLLVDFIRLDGDSTATAGTTEAPAQSRA